MYAICTSLYAVNSHRDDLVSFLEWAYTQEPNAVSLDYPGLRERRDPDFMRDMREYSEIVRYLYILLGTQQLVALIFKFTIINTLRLPIFTVSAV